MSTWIHETYRSEPREGKTTFGDSWSEDNRTYDFFKRGACRVSHILDDNTYLWSVLGYVGHTNTLEKAQEKCQRILELSEEFDRQIDLVKAEKG